MKRFLDIVKIGGEVLGHDGLLKRVDGWFDEIANGIYTLRLVREKPKASAAQTSLAWIWFGKLAFSLSESYGNKFDFTPEMIHDAYCAKFLPIDTPVGPTCRTMRSLNATEMSDFLTKVQQDALERFGIVLTNKQNN